MAFNGAIDLTINSPGPSVTPPATEPVKPKKKLSVLPTFLPPCRVCNATASGYHYGANTCEACKAFFRRSLGNKETVKPCQQDGKCAENPKGKITCSACRLKKCLLIGMTKDGCKKGRYTYIKRTQDTKEVKRKRANDNFCKYFDLQQCTEIVANIAKQFRESFDHILYFYNYKDEIDRRVQELTTSPMKFLEARILYSPGHSPCDIGRHWIEAVNEQFMCRLAAETPEEAQRATTTAHDLLFFGWARQVEHILYGITSFAKSLPGFSDLLIHDRIILLKQGRIETMHVLKNKTVFTDIQCMVNYLPESGDIIVFPWDFLHEVMGDDFMDSLVWTTNKIQKLDLNVEDIAVLLAFLICMPDRVGLQRTDQVEKLQDNMLPILQYTLKKNHPENPNIIRDMLLLLPMLRENSEINMRSLGLVRNRVQREHTPLIFEMLQE